MLKDQRKVKAIFRGQNGSCGYETDKEYTLIVTPLTEKNKNHLEIKKVRHIFLDKTKETGICQYKSIITFLDNWDNIREVPPDNRAM